MADFVGQQFGNYLLTQMLGRGGFADVYLGEHRLLKTQAAIKVMHDPLNEPEFLEEARTIAALTHPNIVRVLEFDVKELSKYHRVSFLVMDYAPQGTLRDRHPRGTIIPLATALLYLQQVADALQYAHDYKVIHRDVKPENMLIGAQGQILLSDFGIATIAHSTASLEIINTSGTPFYMAPEQWNGKPRPASDQYSLGIIMYEWLSGQPPFLGNLHVLPHQHNNVAPAPFAPTLRVPAEVENAIQRALAKNPDQRFPTIQDFAQALEQAGASNMRSSFSSTLSQENPETSKSVRLLPVPTATYSDPPSLNVPHYDFFISHHEADRGMAMWIVDCLQRAGYSVFPLQDAHMRLTFKSEIERALIQATRMVVILSPAYIYTLKSQTTSFDDFKRATANKQDSLVSICVDGSMSMLKGLSEITNYIDLTRKGGTGAEALLLAHISEDNTKLQGFDGSQNRRDHLSASNIPTMLLGPKDQNNPLSSPQISAQASERAGASSMQTGPQNISSQENLETLGSIKLPLEQTLAPVDPASPKYDFFISYNKADRDVAIGIANFIQQAGYSVHFPAKDFRMNFIFINEMNKALNQAKRMIVILSPTYVKVLKSRRGGFTNFKRATKNKPDMLFSICVDSSAFIRKNLPEIENHFDLTRESDTTMIGELLLAHISGRGLNLSASGISLNSINLSISGISQNSSEAPSVAEVPPVLSNKQNSNNTIPPPTKKHVVLLVHGIRTHGAWQEMVRENLEKPNAIQVIPLRYGYFDALRFWFPFLTRKKVIERVHRDIRATLDNHRDSHLSIIAHSFGTYTIAKILEDNPDIRIYRLILCGSVLNTDFRWDKLKSQIEGYQTETDGVINECGTRDIWPILAQISTWGYGAAGSFGFGTSTVTDRYHDYQHGDYFSPQFVRKYWVPFIEQGAITRSNWGPEIPWWMSVLSLLPLRYVIVLGIMLPIIVAGWLIFHH